MREPEADAAGFTLSELEQLIGGEQRLARALAEITDSVLSKGPADAPVTLT